MVHSPFLLVKSPCCIATATTTTWNIVLAAALGGRGAGQHAQQALLQGEVVLLADVDII